MMAYSTKLLQSVAGCCSLLFVTVNNIQPVSAMDCFCEPSVNNLSNHLLRNQEPFYDHLAAFLENELVAIAGSLPEQQQPADLDRNTVRSWLVAWVDDSSQTIDNHTLLSVLRWLYLNHRTEGNLHDQLGILMHLVSQSPDMREPIDGGTTLVHTTVSRLREDLRYILEGLNRDSVGAGAAWEYHIDQALERTYVLLQLVALNTLLDSSRENNQSVFVFMERMSIIVSPLLSAYETTLSRAFLASQLYFSYVRRHSAPGANEPSPNIIQPYIDLLSLYGRLLGNDDLVGFTEQSAEVDTRDVDQIIHRYSELQRRGESSPELPDQLNETVSNFLTYPLRSRQGTYAEPFRGKFVYTLTTQMNQRTPSNSFDFVVTGGSFNETQHDALRKLARAAKAARKE